MTYRNYLSFWTDLFEERAILLGRLGQHHQALAIYTHVLKDTQAALSYCEKYYTSSGPGSEVTLMYPCAILLSSSG